MDIIYFSGIEEVSQIHSKTIDISGGGLKEFKDLGQIESILEHIKNDEYYPEFIDKLTHLVFCTNKFHCFNDGNKRLSIALGGMFLLKNGYLSIVRDFLFKMEPIAYHIAAGKVSKDFLKEILYSILYEDEYSEEIKLKLMDCIVGDY